MPIAPEPRPFMKATTLLLSQHRHIQTLVDEASAAKSREPPDERTFALVEAVAAHLAIEEGVLYPIVERELALDVTAHRDAHVRARLAMFRLATTSSDGFEHDLAILDRVLRDHALAESAIIRALESKMSDGGLIRLGQKMSEFHRRLHETPASALPA
jgi:hypothetical protein